MQRRAEGEGPMNTTPTDFEAICERVKLLFSSSREAMSLARYDVGVEVQRLEAEKGTYGTNAVARLAKIVGRNENSLYAYAKLPAAWARTEFVELAARRTSRGMTLTLSHFVVTASVSVVYREELLALAFARGCSVRALEREVEGLGKGKGDEMRPPPSLQLVLKGTLRSIRTASKSLNRLIGSLQGTDAVKSTKRLTALLERYAELSEELAKEISSLEPSAEEASSGRARRSRTARGRAAQSRGAPGR